MERNVNPSEESTTDETDRAKSRRHFAADYGGAATEQAAAVLRYRRPVGNEADG